MCGMRVQMPQGCRVVCSAAKRSNKFDLNKSKLLIFIVFETQFGVTLLYSNILIIFLRIYCLVYMLKDVGNSVALAAVLPVRAAQFMRFLYALLLRGGQYG